MTKQDFLNMDWNDSHVSYDMKVGNFRTIAYLTLSNKFPKCLCLVTDSKDFQVMNTGCGISRNPCPYDVIKILKRREIDRVIAIIDGIAYDLLPDVMHINGVDSEVCFEKAYAINWLLA